MNVEPVIIYLTLFTGQSIIVIGGIRSPNLVSVLISLNGSRSWPTLSRPCLPWQNRCSRPWSLLAEPEGAPLSSRQRPPSFGIQITLFWPSAWVLTPLEAHLNLADADACQKAQVCLHLLFSIKGLGLFFFFF